MATASPSTGNRNFVEFDEFIDFQLQKTRSNIKTTDILTALAGVATLFLAYLLVFVVFDHWVIDGGFSTPARWLMLGGLFAACIAWIVWRVVIPYQKNVTGLYAAKAIETSEPKLKQSLLTLVDLKRAGKAIPKEIERAIEKRAAVTLHKTDVDAAVDRRPLMLLSYALLALVVLCCLYVVFSPKKISASVWRALFPASQTAVDTSYKIDTVHAEVLSSLQNNRGKKPETFLVYRRDDDTGRDEQHRNLKIAARSTLKIFADLSYTGDKPRKVVLYYATEGSDGPEIAVPMNADDSQDKRWYAELRGRFLDGITRKTTYRIEAGDAKAGPFEITPIRPPVASAQTIHYVYPDYMELPPRTQDGGNIETWEGTNVTVNAVTDQPVTEARLVFTRTEDRNKPVGSVPMTITDGTKLSVTLKRHIALCNGSHPAFYHIQCKGNGDFVDPEPTLYGLTIRADRKPEVEVLDPSGVELELPENTKILPLLYRAKDPDFKVKYVSLNMKIFRTGANPNLPEERSETVFDGPDRKTVQTTYDWQLSSRNLKSGDVVKFYLEARDNMPPRTRTPPWCHGDAAKANAADRLNRGHTPEITLRIVDPVDKNDVQRQLEKNRQRQKQKQQDDPQNNDQDQKAGKQKQDQDNGGKGRQKQKQDQNNNGGGKAKSGKQQGKKNNKSKTKNGGAQGQEKNDPNGQRSPDQKQDGNTGDNATRQRQDGNQPPPKNDADRLNKLLQEEQQRQKQKQKQNGNGTKNKQPDRNTGEQPKNQQNGKQPDNPMNGSKEQKKKQGSKENGDPDGGAKTPKDGQKQDPNKKQTGQKPEGKDPKKDGVKKKKQGTNGEDMGTGQKNAPKTGNKEQTPGNNSKKKPGNGGGKSEKTRPDGMKTTNGESNQPGAKNKENKTPGKAKRQSKDPVNGKKERVDDNGEPAKTKKATGNEKGTAEPNKKPTGDPTKVKKPGQLQRKKGTDPVTKKSKDNPMNPEKKSGSPNPNKVDPKETRKKRQENKDDRTTQPKNNQGQAKEKKTNENNDPGNQKQRGMGRKDGQKAKKPDDGEGGKSKASDQGSDGNQQKGAGNKTEREGNRQKTSKQTGKTGNETGTGSKKQNGTGKKPGGKQSIKQTPDGGNNDPTRKQVKGNEGGKTPGGGAPQQTGKKANRPGQPGAGNRAGNGKTTTPPPAHTEEEDLDYGKKLSNLMLNRLERTSRGPVSDEELKKLGFKSKQDLIDFIARTRKRIKNGDSQIQEQLKSIRYQGFQSQIGKRSGDNVRRKDVSGVGREGDDNIPPHLKRYYEAFRRSLRK